MKVKVWNENKYVYEEKFKNKNVVIQPGEYVEMSLDDAMIFKGTMGPGVRKLRTGAPDPRSFKKLRFDIPSVQELAKKYDSKNPHLDPNKKEQPSGVVITPELLDSLIEAKINKAASVAKPQAKKDKE